MCIIVDTNVFSRVFDDSNKEHKFYKPVYDWIVKRRGMIVYGGSQYFAELSRVEAFLDLLSEYEHTNKLVPLSSSKVDECERKIVKKHGRPFNDVHLLAIVLVSKCRLVCTEDKDATEHLQLKKYYPKFFHLPKIYTKKSKRNLISDKYLEPCFECLRKSGRRK